MGGPSMRSDALGSEPDEDLIPTAIVIKNIPFAVKKEQLVQVMTDMCLPLPYAFNYHFDNGIFRGLAFANFTTPEETAAVIGAMNHLDLHGRKLRVEYKKMLPQVERDRIEREKRERRGQLEEQHRPMAPPILHSQPSMSSMSSNVPANSPSPNSAGAIHSGKPCTGGIASFSLQSLILIVLDMNDPITLQYYTKLIMFQGDGNQETLAFPPSLPPTHRKVVHGLAHQLGLGHVSNGTGEQRQVHIFKNQTGNSNGLSPTISSSIHPLDAQRRQLNRSATTDFTNVRAAEPTLYSNMNTQSTGFLGFPEAQGGGLSVGSNLRNAKSFADLRSYTPSPSHSAASFPAGLASNIARYSEYGQSSPGSSRPNGNGNGNGMGNGNGNGTGNGNGNGSNNTNVDALLANGMNGLNLASGFGGRSGTSPHRLRAMMSWDREGPGPIGGHRLYHMGGEDQNRNRSQGAPMRQPRGPMTDRGPGFSRGRPNGQQNHGGGEDGSINGVEIVVE